MGPTRTTVATVLSLVLIAGRAAGSTGSTGTGSAGPEPQSTAGQVQQVQSPPPDNLERIREAVSHPPAIRIENGQLRIYVEVIGSWPSFAEFTKGYDFMNGPTGYGSPMSHQEFLAMVTPQDMYSTVGIKPEEILTMAVVNYVGAWAINKGLTKLASYRKNKQMREIQAQIDADLAAIKK